MSGHSSIDSAYGLMSFDLLESETLLQAFFFMNGQSLTYTACSHRLGALAAHEAALLVLNGCLEDVTRNLCEKLAARPTVYKPTVSICTTNPTPGIGNIFESQRDY